MTDWRLRALPPEEEAEVLQIVDRLSSGWGEVVRGGVLVQARIGAEVIDTALLDTSVLLFDHVLLCVEGLDYRRNPGMPERILAYSDAGYLTPVVWDTLGGRGFHTSKDDYYDVFGDVPEALLAKSVNLPRVADNILDLRTADIREMATQLAWLDHFRIWDSISESGLSQLLHEINASAYTPRLDYMLKSLCEEQILARMLQSSCMPRQELASLARALVVQEQLESDVGKLSLKGDLAAWYANASKPFPRFANPSTVVSVKEAMGGESLQATVERLIQAGSSRVVPYSELLAETAHSLDAIIAKSHRFGGRTGKVVEASTSALAGSIGGVVGGSFGAVIGAIGGAAVPLFVELWKGRDVSWASYFA